MLLALGGLLGAVGLEDALTVWNDQMALLPWGMARILGITTFLGIPTDLPTSPEDLESLLSDLPSDLPTDLESLLSDLPSQ